jgi:NAD(P)H-hydrate epimerase
MRLADSTGAVVVLKGNPTFVAGSSLGVVTSGGPELATIGTGDVLAGLIAALVATGVPVEDAARTGTYLHGLAGSSCARSQTLVATDLVDEIGRDLARRRGSGPGSGTSAATVPGSENGA